MKNSSKDSAMLFRSFLLSRFHTHRGKIDFDAAGRFFGVSPWTVRRWHSGKAPAMALRMAHMATRMIPDSKDWDGFYFGRDGRLHTPVARLSFSGNELNFQHYEKQFAANDRRARAALEKQLRAVRSEDERKKAIQEIEFVLETLKGLQRSPLLATEGVNIQ